MPHKVKHSDGVYRNSRDFNAWTNIMLRSGRIGNHSEKYPTYSGCSCSELFSKFEPFVGWFSCQKGYDKAFHIDKDLLFEGNKVYSEDTCILLPRELNVLFKVKYSTNNTGFVGVTKVRNKYRAVIANPEKSVGIHLGYFLTPEEADLAYRIEKANIIIRLTEKYANDLDERAVIALKLRANKLY